MALLRSVKQGMRIRLDGIVYRPVHTSKLDSSLMFAMNKDSERLFVRMDTGRLALISENFEVEIVGECAQWNAEAQMEQKMNALRRGMESTIESAKSVRQD